MKKVKHVSRKVTQAQVDGMNRELEMKGTKNYRYVVGEDGRLTTQEIMTCWW